MDSLYKIIKRSKLDNFVSIKPDVVNGFAYYHDTEKANAFHDAGFDSIITGRCFVHILKSLENNFDVNQTKQGLLDLTNEKFLNLINRTYLSMIEEPFGIIDFAEKIDAIISKAKEFKLEVFKMVKAVVYKPKDLTIYEMVKVLDNDTYNISIVKIDDDKAFVEFFASRYDKDRNKIENGNENNDFELFIENLTKNETIEKILDYEEFEANLNNLIFT